MKLLEEVGIRFLIGLFFTVLIGFLFWWFVIHNESDRIVERSFQRFYAALEKACDNHAIQNSPVIVDIEIPQTRTKVLERMIEEVEKITRGAKLEIPFQAFQDPYYSFHWERFPPEPPYTVTADITQLPQTLAAIFIPWSEDLPWTSNLFLTIGINSFFFGIDLFGGKILKKTLLETKNTLFNSLEEVKRRLKANNEMVREIIDFISGVKEKVVFVKEKMEIVFERVGEEIKVIKKIGGKVVGETSFITKTTAYYTLFCLVAFDKTLGECLVEGSLFSTFGMVPTKYFLRKVNSLFLKTIKVSIWKIEAGISDFTIKIKDYFIDYIRYLRMKFSFLQEYFSSDELKRITDLQNQIEESMMKLERIVKIEKNKEAALRIIDETIKKIEEIIKIISKKVGKEEKDEIANQMLIAMKSDLDINLEHLFDLKKKIIEEGLTERAYATIGLEYLEKAFEDIVTQKQKYTRKYLENLGFIPKEIELRGEKKVFLVLDDKNNKYFKEIAKALEMCRLEGCKHLGRYGDFEFLYEKDQLGLKMIVYNPVHSPIDDYIKMPANVLKRLVGKVIYKDMISNEVMIEVLEEFKKTLMKNNNERLLELVNSFKRVGIDVSPEEVLSMMDKTIYRLKEQDIIGVLVAIDTKLYKLLVNFPELQKNPKELSHAIREYFYKYLLEAKDKDEIKYFYDFINGKSFKLTEDLGVFFRTNPIGYAFLRAIDLYTPMGASYWDRYFSLYGYTGQKLPAGCQTSCDDKKICLQLGACFRQFELPESCKKKGVENIKLERNSLVAPNPRFYLVSPCYGKAKLYLKDENGKRNLYVSIEIDKSKGISYCYATAGLVNFYISTYITQYASQVACTAVISILTGGLGSPLALKACPFFIELILDVIREATLVWPSVYQIHPYLA